MSATQIKRTVLEMSNAVEMTDRANPLATPWYLDYEFSGNPVPLPPLYVREYLIKLLPYEKMQDCVLNNNTVLCIKTIKGFPPKQLLITVTEDEYNKDVDGTNGGIGAIIITKLIAALVGIFGEDYSTLKHYEINITDPANPIITDETP